MKAAPKLEPSEELQAKLKELKLQVIMKEYDSNEYIPDDEEIRDYAEYLGLELPEDEDLLWLAKEGLQVALPPGWKPYQNAANDLFYVNVEQNLLQVEHPLDEVYQNRAIQQKAKKARRKALLEEESAIQEESQLTKTLTGQDEVFKRQDDLESLGNSIRKMTSSDFVPSKHPTPLQPLSRPQYTIPKQNLVTEESEEEELYLIEEINAKMSQAYSNKIQSEIDNIDMPSPAVLPKTPATLLEREEKEISNLAEQLKAKQKLLEDLTRQRVAKEKQLLDMELEFEAKKQRIVENYRSRMKKQLENGKARKKKELEDRTEALKKQQLAMLYK